MDKGVVHQHVGRLEHEPQIVVGAGEGVGQGVLSDEPEGGEDHEHAVGDGAHASHRAGHAVHGLRSAVGLIGHPFVAFGHEVHILHKFAVLSWREAELDGAVCAELLDEVEEVESQRLVVPVHHGARHLHVSESGEREALFLRSDAVEEESAEEPVLGRAEHLGHLVGSGGEHHREDGRGDDHPFAAGAAAVGDGFVVEGFAEPFAEVAHAERLGEGVELGLEDQAAAVVLIKVLVDGGGGAVARDDDGAGLVERLDDLACEAGLAFARGGRTRDEDIEVGEDLLVEKAAVDSGQTARECAQGREEEHVGRIVVVRHDEHPVEEVGQPAVGESGQPEGVVGGHRTHIGIEAVVGPYRERHQPLDEFLLLAGGKAVPFFAERFVGSFEKEVDEFVCLQGLVEDVVSTHTFLF